jgi:biopolymer transport protein TolR
MAGVSSEHGSGSLNVELNLVPFIDLLSSLVLFLLVTAVWTQVSVISASVSPKGKSTVVQNDSNRIVVRVAPGGYQITWPGALAGKGLATSLGRQPPQLLALMKKAMTISKNGLPITALSGDDTVPYESVIQALDAIKSAGIESVGLSTE